MKNYILFLLCFVYYTVICSAHDTDRPFKMAVIAGTYTQIQPSDTVILTLWPHFLSNKKRNYVPYRRFISVIKNKQFYFKIDSLRETVYFTLDRFSSKGKRTIFSDKQLCSPGDDVNIQISDNKAGKTVITDWGNTSCSDCENFTFSGRGAEKYKCLLDLKTTEKALYNSYLGKPITSPTIIERFEFDFDRQINHMMSEQLNILKRYQRKLSDNTYELIKADIVGYRFATVLAGITRYHSALAELTIEKKTALYKIYKTRMRQFEKVLNISIPTQVQSAMFPVMSLYKTYAENALFYHQTPYDLIKEQYSGVLRDRLITNYLIDNSDMPRADSLVKDALNILQTKPYHAVLSFLLKNQQVGAMAYNFALPDSLGRIVRLSDFRGKLVFIDFWFTGCSGCSYYFKHSVSKAEEIFRDNQNVVFITVSVDSNKQLWHKGLNSGLFTSSDAINLYTADQGANHPITRQFYIKTFPHPLLIGKDGKILSNDVVELFDKGADGLISAINKALAQF